MTDTRNPDPMPTDEYSHPLALNQNLRYGGGNTKTSTPYTSINQRHRNPTSLAKSDEEILNEFDGYLLTLANQENCIRRGSGG